MYEAYFNFKMKPFELVPNPDFLYLSKTHQKAIYYLRYGILEKAGFILLTGDVGSGKTTLISDLTQQLSREVTLAKVFNTKVSSEQLFALINDDYELDIKGKDKVMLLKDLNNFLVEQHAKKKNTVLIIDEAQNLDMELLEEIRMLSNLETNKAKLIQIVLVGQPELRDLLARPELRQLRQRINIQSHLYPLTRDETLAYIFHRFEVAGNRDALELTDDAVSAIHQYCRGIPRLTNILCDFLLLSAFNEETRKVDAGTVHEIAKDLEFNAMYWDMKNDGVKKKVHMHKTINTQALLNALGIGDLKSN